MGDVNGRRGAGAQGLTQFANQFHPQGMVQRAEWFIQHQQTRVGRQSAGQGNALLFPTGKFRYRPAAKSFHVDAAQGLADLLIDKVGGFMLHFQTKGDVSTYRTVRKKCVILKHQTKASLMGWYAAQVRGIP